MTRMRAMGSPGPCQPGDSVPPPPAPPPTTLPPPAPPAAPPPPGPPPPPPAAPPPGGGPHPGPDAAQEVLARPVGPEPGDAFPGPPAEPLPEGAELPLPEAAPLPRQEGEVEALRHPPEETGMGQGVEEEEDPVPGNEAPLRLGGEGGEDGVPLGAAVLGEREEAAIGAGLVGEVGDDEARLLMVGDGLEEVPLEPLDLDAGVRGGAAGQRDGLGVEVGPVDGHGAEEGAEGGEDARAGAHLPEGNHGLDVAAPHQLPRHGLGGVVRGEPLLRAPVLDDGGHLPLAVLEDEEADLLLPGDELAGEIRIPGEGIPHGEGDAVAAEPVEVGEEVRFHGGECTARAGFRRTGAEGNPAPRQARIIVSSILNRSTAMTAWGTSAGMRRTSPAFMAWAFPPRTTEARPSSTCTRASKGAVCSLNPWPASKAKSVTVPFSFFTRVRLTTDPGG